MSSGNGSIQHLEVKSFSGVGMLRSNLFVELNTQPGSSGWNDVAVFPPDRLVKDFGVKAAPGLDALLDQEIGAARTDLDVGRTFDRPTVLPSSCRQATRHSRVRLPKRAVHP